MLVSGAAAACFDHLDKMRLAGCFLPAFGLAMREPASRKFILDAMTRTDARVAEDKPINPAFQLAAVLWPAVNTRWQLLAASRNSDLQAALDAIEEILHEQRGLIPARLTTTMREIWSLQPRFTQRTGRRPHRLLEHPRFRAAYDFLMVRGAAGEVENDLVDWWTDFQTLDAGGQDALQMQLTEPAASAPKKRRRRRKPSEKGAASPVTTHD